MDPAQTLSHPLHQEEITLPQRIGIQDMDSTRYMIYGSFFILATNATLFPLDTLTTIVMADQASSGSISIPKLIRRIAQKEGIFRFWRGVLPTVLGAFPGQAMYYYSYETVQELNKTLFLGNKNSEFTTFFKGFLSGACAELAGGLFYVPADVVSQRLQVQNVSGFTHNARLYKGPLDIVRKVLRSEGIRGFYRGYLAYLLAYAPGSAVQWGSYELSKSIIYKSITLLERRNFFSNDGAPIPGKETLINAVSGGFAATCAVSANNPLEVLRIRLQLLDSTHPAHKARLKQGYIPLAKRMICEEGWKAFYKGLKVRLFVAVPTAMVAMSGYETVKAWSLD